MLPLTGGFESAGFMIEGRPPQHEPGHEPSALYTGVSDGYFRAMGIPLIRGRLFDASDRDSTSATVIVSQAMARTYWPNQDPIGARLHTMFGRPLEIVGVVGDIRHQDIRSAPTPAMYFPLSLYPTPNMYLVVRTAGDPLGALPAVRQALRAIDPAVPLTQVLTMEQLMAGSLAEQRMSATLVAIFALAALGLAVIGLYGVVSFGVARRLREIGIRLALGASPESVVGGVLAEGATLSLLGVALGIAGAVALGRVLSRMVFEVSPSDPPTLAVVSLLLVVVALAASLVPARRAMRVDPATALREE